MRFKKRSQHGKVEGFPQVLALEGSSVVKHKVVELEGKQKCTKIMTVL